MALVTTSPPPPVDLAGVAPELREMFTLRLERWWPDLHDALVSLHGTGATALAEELVSLAAQAFRDRSPALRRRDLQRILRPDWLQDPSMIGYAAYTERFAGNLRGVVAEIPYLRDLGVTYLHLMPLLQPREGDNDGGYAVADYRAVRPDLGDMDDLADLAAALHEEGVSLVLDLVLNHVAREHDWAARARAGETAYREYFHVFPDRTLPDAYERTLPEVFPDFAPGSFTWDDELAGWVWTTFNEWQWDLNWANPAVLREFTAIILELANRGVDVFRLDAIAFMWKRMGTDCQGEPEVHAITQALRAVTRIACPAVAFKAEAIVAPSKLLAYLGQGRYSGKVSDLAYHNSLMVQVWSMLATKDVRLAAHALERLPTKPTTSTWLTYLRCHDDIGWAIQDEDAAAVGLDGHAHRRFLTRWYAGDEWGSNADGLVFQYNPETDDGRTSGTSASLVGLSTARTDEERDLAARALRLGHAVVLGWGGIPVIWSGDELGQPNDPDWADEPGHEDDNRWAHRPRLDWHRASWRHDDSTVAGKVFQGVAHLARVRAGLPQLHASARTTVLPDTDDGILAVFREHPAGPMLCLYNVTDAWRPFPFARFAEAGIAEPHNSLGDHPVHGGPEGDALLSPYAAWWVVDAASLTQDLRAAQGEATPHDVGHAQS